MRRDPLFLPIFGSRIVLNLAYNSRHWIIPKTYNESYDTFLIIRTFREDGKKFVISRVRYIERFNKALSSIKPRRIDFSSKNRKFVLSGVRMIARLILDKRDRLWGTFQLGGKLGRQFLKQLKLTWTLEVLSLIRVYQNQFIIYEFLSSRQLEM